MNKILALPAALILLPAASAAATKGSRALPGVPRFVRHLADPVMPLAAPFVDPLESEQPAAFLEPQESGEGERITSFIEPDESGRSESLDLRTRVAHMSENADQAVERISARETTNEGATGGADAAFRALTGEEAAPAVSGDEDPIAAVNAAVAEALVPVNQKPDTKAEVVFTKLRTNAQRTVEVALGLKFYKKGPGGEADLQVGELAYSFPEAPDSVPETRANVSLKLDLTKLIPQKDINQLGPRADKFVNDFLRDYRARYNDAAKLDVRVTHQDWTGEGENRNLTGLGLVLNFDIDLAKLPQGMDPKRELVTKVESQAELTLKAIELSLRFLSNPEHRNFAGGQRGLKEALDALIRRDPKAIAEIRGFVNNLDEYAERVTAARPK